jgi:hypothetical protein
MLLLPFSILAGQEKNSEQKIKIIINDGSGSGSKVVIDTLIKDGSLNDSIRLKDGKVIFISHPDGNDNMKQDAGSYEHMFVTVTNDSKESKKDFKTITIVSSDSAIVTEETEGGKVIVMSSSSDPSAKSGTHYIVTSAGPEKEGKSVEKIIYINEGNSPENEQNRTYDVSVSENDKDSSVEKTRYVIAKDGIVVSVEGNDEVKVKELIKEIEKKMDVKSGESGKKETVTVETKKSVNK